MALAAMFLVALVPCAVDAGTYVAPVVQDTWIEQAGPTEVHGGDAELRVHSIAADSMRALYHFDTSGIPSLSVISNATATFHVQAPDITGNPIRVYRITQPWFEVAASWSTSADDYDGATIYGTFAPTAEGELTVDITSLVQEWVLGTHPNYGLMLIATSSDIESRYASREGGVPAERPSLVVTTLSSADLEITKDVDNPSPTVGETITYAIVLQNLGPDAATNVEVTDLLPAGVRYVSHTPSQGIYNAVTGVWDVGSVDVGFTAGLAINATVEASASGAVVTNVAAVTAASESDPVPGNNSDSAVIKVPFDALRMTTGTYVGTGAPGLSVVDVGFRPSLVLVRAQTSEFAVARTSTMSGDASKLLGDNTGLVADRITSLDDNGFTVGSSAEVNAIGVTYNWSAFQAAPGQMAVGSYRGDGEDDRAIESVGFEPVYVIVMPDENEHAMQRFATEASDKSLPLNGDTEKANRIQDFLPLGFEIGDHNTVNDKNLWYHYAAFNATPDLIAQGEYLGNGTNNRNINAPDFQPRFVLVKNRSDNHQSIVRMVEHPADTSIAIDSGPLLDGAILDFIGNGFQVGSSDPVNKDNDWFQWVTFRDQPVADLALDKQVDNPTPNEGELITYTVTLQNSGPNSATGVEVLDLLPPGVTYVSHNATGGTYDEVTGVWTPPPSIVPGGSVTLDITASVDPGTKGSIITNTATITATGAADPDSGERTASADISVQCTDLAIYKMVDSGIPLEGDTLTFTVIVANEGPDNATGVVVTDFLPAGVTFLSSYQAKGVYDDGTGDWTVGDVAAGQSDTLLIEASVDSGTAGSTIFNTAEISAVDQGDSDLSDQAATAGFTVAATDLELAKVVDNSTPLEGETVVYTVTVVNVGPNSATGVTIADSLPAGVTWVGDTPSQGAYDSGLGVWTVGTMAAGDTATLDITVLVDTGSGGATISNVASVSTLDQDDPDPSDNTASVDITPQGADVVVTKAGPASVTENDTLLYMVTVKNDGPADATDVAIADSLPASVVFVSASDGGSEAGGVVTWPVIGSLAAADSVVYTIAATAPATGVLTNIARSAAPTYDPAPTNNDGSLAASRVITVVAPADSFVISSVVSPHEYVTPGQELVDVAVTVSNQNGFDVRIVSGGPTFTNAIPDDRAGDYSVVPSPSNPDTILAGEIVTLRYTVAVAAAALTDTPIVVDAGYDVEDIPGVWTSSPSGAVVPHTWRVVTDHMRVLASLYDTKNTPIRSDDALVGSIDVTNVLFDSNVALGSLGAVLQNDSTVYRLALQFNPLLAQYNLDADASGEGYWGITGSSQGLVAEASDGANRELLIPGAFVADESTSPIDHVKAVTKEFTPPIPWSPLTDITTSPVIDQAELGEFGSISTGGPPLGDFVDCIDGAESWKGGGGVTPDQFFITELWFRPDMQWSAGDTATLTFHLDGEGVDAPEITGLGVELVVADDDTTGPVITSLAPDIALSTMGVSVEATIVDPSGVYDDATGSAGQGVYLLWDIDGELTVDANEITMSRAAGDTFATDAPIPPQAAGATVSYQVFAYDDDSDGGITTDRTQGASAIGTIDVFEPVSLDDAPGSLYPTSAYPGETGVALRVGVDNDQPVGVTLSTGSSIEFSDSTETYTALLTNPTYVPPGASNFTLTFGSQTVPSGISALTSYALRLSLDGATDAGFAYADTVLTTGTNSIYIESPRVWAEAAVTGSITAHPGERDVAILSMRLHNTYAADRDLDSLTVTNTSTGVGSPAQLDAIVESLSLYNDADSSHTLTPSDVLIAKAGFAGGSAIFDVSAWTLPARGRRSLIVALDVDSTSARDGDVLDAAVLGPSDVVFVQPTYVDPSLSLDSFGDATINGSMAFQMGVSSPPGDTLFSSQNEHLVATITLPQNGYAADVLTSLELKDYSGAFAPTDFDYLALYEDDGDGSFDPALDTALGEMAFSGDRYEISGLSRSLDGGNLFFVAADVADDPGNADRFLPGIPVEGVNVESGNDGPLDAAVVAADTLVIIRVEKFDVVNLGLGALAVGPGDVGVPMLSFSAHNNTLQPAVLDSITVVNATVGAGSPAQLDAQMGAVRLYRDDGNGVVDPWDAELAQGTFTAGSLVFDALGLPFSPATLQRFIVTCDIDSFCVRDGDSLRVALPDASALSFDTAPLVAGSFPMATDPARVADGMEAFQVHVYESSDSLIITSPVDNLVFDFAVPANGYAADTLEALTIVNLGTATDEHIRRYYLYADGGDGALDAGAGDDSYLGDFTPVSPKVYELTGLSLPLLEACGGGTRLFVASELESNISSGASIQLSIPAHGILVASDNDGPVTNAVVNPSIQFIPTPDELTVFPYSVGDKKVYPGSSNVLNFGVGFYNGFSTPVTLESARLFQQGSAISSEILEVRAYADADTNGLFNIDADTLVASTTSSDVYYDLSDFALSLQPQRITYLFVAYDNSMYSRDSVTVNLQLNGAADLTFDGSISVEGEFPINSPGVDTIDGMIAAQASLRAAQEYRAAPSEEDVLVMGVTFPSNGFLPDILDFVTVANVGTAVAAQDVTLLKLWVEDGGDPLRFDPAADRLASALFWTGTGWRNPTAMGEFVALEGLRCYITASFAATATDGRTVQASIPVGGVEMDSGNDGPLDLPLINTEVQTISTDPLITSLETDGTTYSVGQPIVVTMHVRNEGLSDLLGVTPSALGVSGAGGATPTTGPNPATLDLAAGADTSIVWTLTAAVAGDLAFCANAVNADSSEMSLPTCASGVLIQKRASDLSAALSDVAQPDVNRGQGNHQLVRIHLDYAAGDSLSAPARLTGLTLSVLDGGNAPLAPNQVLDAVTLFSSTGTNYGFTLVDSTSNPLRLLLDDPIVIAPATAVDMTVYGDIATQAAPQQFKLQIATVADILVADANDTSAVTLTTGDTFPWRTKAINVTLPATSLTIDATGDSLRTVNLGQDDVAVFELDLLNTGPPQSANEILSSMTLSFHDTTGAAIPPGAVARALSIESNGVTLYFSEALPSVATKLVGDFATVLLLPPQITKPIDVVVDLRSFPAYDGFRMTIEEPSSITARDNNSGDLVEVAPADTSASFPIGSTVIVFQDPASGLNVAHESLTPNSILPASAGMPVLNLSFFHPDGSASNIAVDSLAFEFVDGLGESVFPGDYFTLLTVVCGGDTIGAVTSLSGVSPLVECKLDEPIVLLPGTSDSATVYVDSKSAFSPVVFRVRVDRDYVHARDVNSGERILSLSGAFPFLTEPCYLQIPGADVVCGVESRLPDNVAGDEAGLPAFDLVVANDAPAGYTDAELRTLSVRIENWKGETLRPSDVAGAAVLLDGDSAVAVGAVGDNDIAFTLSPGAVVVQPEESRALTVELDLAAKLGNESFRFVIADTSATLFVDAATGAPVAAGTAGGGYPLVTRFTHVLGNSVENGFTNYPNPFAAGRETTRITYYLDAPGKVTLKLYTLWGAPVATLLDGVSETAGLHQDVTWDGRNDDGDVVNNGVYYLVLEAGSISMKRKVGVVR